MAADGLGAVLGLGEPVAGDDLKGMLKYVCHVVPVKGLASSGGVGLLQVPADILASPDIDPEAALHPQNRFYQAVDIIAICFTHFRCAVDKGFAYGHFTAGALYGDAQGRLGVLQERLVEPVKGNIAGVQFGGVLQRDFNTKTVHCIVPPSKYVGPCILRPYRKTMRRPGGSRRL